MTQTTIETTIEQPIADEAAFMIWLSAEGYLEPRPIGEGVYAAIKPFAFTHAIIVSEIGDYTGYLDRWCYASYQKAASALAQWNGEGEPTGWHRHPSSGRRVSDNPNTIDDQGRRVPVGQMYHYA